MIPLRAPFLESNIAGWPLRRGKVRDVYDLGDRLLFVASDRISAFDWVLPNGIPDKGRVLTQLSRFWFERLPVRHHLLTTDLSGVPFPPETDRGLYDGRAMVVQKVRIFPIECVVRGYLSGSGWKEYRQSSTVCGITLPQGLRESEQLPEPIFTPATKAESGHDENIPFETMCGLIGRETAEELRRLSLQVYEFAREHARRVGIILADTKFEFGEVDGRIVLADEVLTPDSSRFWVAAEHAPGRAQASFDKQFVRDWLETTGWDKNSPPPALPADVITKTRDKYIDAFERLSGERFAWR